ncbi:MAG: uracil-DNA glycosylase [Clostridia bacterium]|nr:uracil-DNA glycosylase [Clostridia bacterium]
MRFFGNSWDNVLDEEFQKEYFIELLAKVDEEYQTRKIYPPRDKIFSALKLCDFKDIKVVLLGQDPYHGEGQAHGLCFSVMPGVTPPPSLKNIYKELASDVGFVPPNHGCLISWARQGVLLLNTTLTVREGQPNSHSTYGWQTFTDEIIKKIDESDNPVVFLLWGGNAKSKMKLIKNKKHLVLYSAHPSPLSAYNGFFGNKHFSKTNEFLVQNGKTPIDWSINNI